MTDLQLNQHGSSAKGNANKAVQQRNSLLHAENEAGLWLLQEKAKLGVLIGGCLNTTIHLTCHTCDSHVEEICFQGPSACVQWVWLSACCGGGANFKRGRPV